MARNGDHVRVTITLPADLYAHIRDQTDNFSAFVAETLAHRIRTERLIKALDDTAGMMAETFKDLRTPEDVIAFLHRERAGWNRDPE